MDTRFSRPARTLPNSDCTARRISAGLDLAHENVTLGATAGRGGEWGSAVLEPAVLENHQIAGIQLLPEHLFANFVGARLLVIFIQIRHGAVAFPVQDIENDKLFLVLMRLGHDVGVSPKQIDPERASRPPPVFG